MVNTLSSSLVLKFDLFYKPEGGAEGACPSSHCLQSLVFCDDFVLIEVKLIIHNAAVLKQKDVGFILKKFFFLTKSMKTYFTKKILVLFYYFSIFSR